MIVNERTPTGAERLFWSEIRAEQSTRRSVAVTYAILFAEHAKDTDEFWKTVNIAVINRFRMKTEAEFHAFQSKAKTIYVGAAHAICPAIGAGPAQEAVRDGVQT